MSLRYLIAVFALIALIFKGQTASFAEDMKPPPQMYIEVKKGLLSVEILNGDFGDALRKIGAMAGFAVEIPQDIASKKLSTSFKDVELEKAIVRMFTLIRHKTYSIDYSTEGKISGVTVLTTEMPTDKPKEKGIIPLPRRMPPVQATPAPQPVQKRPIPREQSFPQDPNLFQDNEEQFDEPLYIPPRKEPAYIPKKGE